MDLCNVFDVIVMLIKIIYLNMFLFIIHINVIHAGNYKTEIFILINIIDLNRFYCDSSLDLDEHNRTHTPNTLSKSTSSEQISISLPTPVSIPPKTFEPNSEKSTPSSKAKVHRCRQCPFISSIKV
jgi:hypothetical protein